MQANDITTSWFNQLQHITPPITPLKSRRKKEVSPINVQVATAHFRDTWRTPPKRQDDFSLDIDALDTPPLSAASTSGEASAPLDVVHPLFGNLTPNEPPTCKVVGDGESERSPLEELPSLHLPPSDSDLIDVFTSACALSHPHSPSSFIPPSPLPPSTDAFMPSTDQYHYTTSNDTLHFFTSDSGPSSQPSSSPATTPRIKKRSRTRRSGRTRVLGDSPRRTTPTRPSPGRSMQTTTSSSPHSSPPHLLLPPRILSPVAANRSLGTPRLPLSSAAR